MIKRLLPFALALLVAPAVSASESDWLTSLDGALAKAEKNDSMILVDLYADWCGWCKVLEEKVFTTPAFRDFTKDFVLLRVDVEDGAEGSALQARFGAYSLPTTLIMNKDQVKIGTVAGFAPTPAFLQKLSAEIASYEAFLEYFDKMKKSDDLGVLYQLAQELHYKRGDGKRTVEVLRQILKRTGESSPKAGYLHYLMADAHRMAGHWDEAHVSLEKAHALSHEPQQRELRERIDMLSYRIAQDSHNCTKAKKSLEHFLEAHPKSSYRREVERALDDLRQGRGLDCV